MVSFSLTFLRFLLYMAHLKGNITMLIIHFMKRAVFFYFFNFINLKVCLIES